MVRKIIHFEIPLYIAIFILLVFSAAVFFITQIYFSNIIYNYSVYIPDASKTNEAIQFGSWPALSNRDFYAQVKNQFIANKASFLEADLSAMKVRLYDNGSEVKEAQILSKGKEGSWWETPVGLYKIEVKDKNLFSSFGHVYMPWSMSFQGNFFIHGWPYYPDGTPIAPSYSGGCIRLSTDDAQAIYDLVKVGTPVLVFKDGFQADSFGYALKIPDVSAKSFLVADLSNNFVFASKSPKLQLPVASLAKLVTALVAVEYINIEKEITVVNSDIVPTSYPRFKAGDQVSLFNLLHLLLLESSNEAAEAIASYTGRERFIGLMNDKAKSIGMVDTKFTDPSGRDAGNVSTIEDLFTLSQYLLKNRSFILKITAGTDNNSAYGPVLYGNIKNFNVFHDNPDFIGGKVGLSGAASDTLISIFDANMGGQKRDLALILLGSSDYVKDGSDLLSWVKENYTGATSTPTQ